MTGRERAAAAEEFRDLLLPEALAAKLGHASFHRVEELQLQDLGLRSLGDVLQGDAWPCLRNLCLAGNQLTGVRHILTKGMNTDGVKPPFDTALVAGLCLIGKQLRGLAVQCSQGLLTDD